MLFLLDVEKEFDFVTQDSLIIKQLLDANKDKFNYIIMSTDDFYNDKKDLLSKESFPYEYIKAIPVGSIQFVSAFLKIFFNIDGEEAFEIPEYLRNDNYLKRKYEIVSYSNLPQEGNYFIKDVTAQRTFSYLGSIHDFFKLDDAFIDKEHKFLVSEILEVYSEYRIYVIRDCIKNISFYKGNPEILPDIDFIKEVINDYRKCENHLESYSLDIMVTSKGSAIIEMHTFLSLGLYSTKCDGSMLLGYIDGLNHVLKNSKASMDHVYERRRSRIQKITSHE